MARRFEDATQFHDSRPDARGWGQFLDAPKHHKQIGLYGTSAGVLVLALAGRGKNAVSDAAISLLKHWWDARETEEYGRGRFVQTLRLAFLNLAVRLSGTDGSDPF